MCGEEENTAENFLEQCPAIAQIRGQYFQDLSVNEQLIVAEELDVYQTGVTITISDYSHVFLVHLSILSLRKSKK